MPREPRPPSTSSSLSVARPAGAPDWVSAELLAETVAAWQPYYEKELTVDDALEIVLAVGRLTDILGHPANEEEQVPGPGPRQQS